MKNDLADEKVTMHDVTRHCEEGKHSAARRGNLLNGLLRHFVPRNDENSGNSQSLINVKNLKTYHLNVLTTSRKVAFTLAEVLITLGVIGIVAAMTIPTLIDNYRAAEMRTRLTKSYSVISQAFELMKIDNGGYVDLSSYSDGHKFAPAFQQYLKTVKADVGKTNTDMPSYKNFAGNADFNMYLLDDGTLYLSDGTIIFIENPNKAYYNLSPHVYIFADINGIKKPNVLGKDLFGFYISDNKLIPMGANNNAIKKEDYFGNNVPSDDEDNWCNETSKSVYNGLSCTYKALNDKDYFKNIFAK